MSRNTVLVFIYEHVHCNAIIDGMHVLIEGTKYSTRDSKWCEVLSRTVLIEEIWHMYMYAIYIYIYIYIFFF